MAQDKPTVSRSSSTGASVCEHAPMQTPRETGRDTDDGPSCPVSNRPRRDDQLTVQLAAVLESVGNR